MYNTSWEWSSPYHFSATNLFVWYTLKDLSFLFFVVVTSITVFNSHTTNGADINVCPKIFTVVIIYMKKFLHGESMSINPKQCKNLKFFECRNTKLVQKVEIECKNLKLNWLTGKSRKRNSQMANQIFCFQIKRMPWMAQFIAQFFPDCVIRVRSFCSTISNFFHQLAWRNFSLYIIKR